MSGSTGETNPFVTGSLILNINSDLTKYKMLVSIEPTPRATFIRFLKNVESNVSDNIRFNPEANQETIWRSKSDGTVEITSSLTGVVFPTYTTLTIPSANFATALKAFLKIT